MTYQGKLVLTAAAMLSAVLGTVHAFSIFLVPLENTFDASRSAVSFVYSLALICITAAVFFGHDFYARWRADLFVLAIALTAATGVALAGVAPSLGAVWFTYGVLFGAANGFGYGFGLQFAAQVNPGREGMAMGVVTAAYAFGAIIAPIFFAMALGRGGFSGAMFGLAATIVVVGLIAAALIRYSQARYRLAAAIPQAGARSMTAQIARLWIGYGAATFAGLMVIGHAQGLVVAKGYDGPIWHATVLISVLNLAGSLVAGRMIDRAPVHRPLILLPVISLAALVLLALVSAPMWVAAALAVIGFSYGGIIAAYPAAVAALYGQNDGPRVYGKVFTAWGFAGLTGPWLAGSVFDFTGTYTMALWIAACLSAVAALAAVPLRNATIAQRQSAWR